MNRGQKIIIGAIEKYQKYISQDHGDLAKNHNHVPYCKYYPSCSEYSKQAIEKKGVFLGGLKAFWRILRCQPWSKGGYDPVEKDEEKKSQ